MWFPDQRHQNHQEPVLDPTPDLLPPRRSSAGKESACNVEDLGSILGSGRSPGEGIGCPLQCYWASLVAQTVKSLPAMWETWVGKIRWRRERLPTPGFWPGEFHGLYSPWGHKESDKTEQLSLSFTSRPTESGTSEGLAFCAFAQSPPGDFVMPNSKLKVF